jgi:hypothetical protein
MDSGTLKLLPPPHEHAANLSDARVPACVRRCVACRYHPSRGFRPVKYGMWAECEMGSLELQLGNILGGLSGQDRRIAPGEEDEKVFPFHGTGVDFFHGRRPRDRFEQTPDQLTAQRRAFPGVTCSGCHTPRGTSCRSGPSGRGPICRQTGPGFCGRAVDEARKTPDV